MDPRPGPILCCIHISARSWYKADHLLECMATTHRRYHPVRETNMYVFVTQTIPKALVQY